MTRTQALDKALARKITWKQAAQICAVSTRQMRRIRKRYEDLGLKGLEDGRRGKRQPRRIPSSVVQQVCKLRTDIYADFSMRHFHQFAVERHGIDVSYTWIRDTLLAHGLACRADGRGRYRRRRPRRPMTGMLLHLDASQHEWIEGLPLHDLVVVLDDADGRMLYARFFTQETTLSTLSALQHVLKQWGRFCELYTDRASHFCNTTDAVNGPDTVQRGVVPMVLHELGIKQILARTPQARGRGERAFGTIQGRLPQELRLNSIRSYHKANQYLRDHFIDDFNRRFTVRPAQPETAFVPLEGVDLELLLSVQHERIVRNDNTVQFKSLVLQIPRAEHRIHFVRCKVLVHEFPDETLGISHEGKLLGRFHRNSELIRKLPRQRRLDVSEHERVVRRDHTVHFQKLILDVPPAQDRANFVGCHVTVHEYADGGIDISHEGTVIGRYHRNSNTIRRRRLRYKRVA